MLYTTKFCCNSILDHPDAHLFKLQDFLPGRLPGNELPSDPVSVEAEKEKSNSKHRLTKDRPALDFRLIEWLKLEHASDTLRAVRPPHFILSQAQRLILTRTNPNQIQSPSDITSLLAESSDWADEWETKIFDVIHTFDADLHTLNCQNGNGKKRKRN